MEFFRLSQAAVHAILEHQHIDQARLKRRVVHGAIPPTISQTAVYLALGAAGRKRGVWRQELAERAVISAASRGPRALLRVRWACGK
jgi:hypothetical protein